MALRKGIPNNLTAARKAFTQLKHDRERYEAAGLGPGDSYRGLWAMLHEWREELKHAQGEEKRNYYRTQVTNVLVKILPFERPRLMAAALSTDPNAPLMDMTQLAQMMAKALTNEEMATLDVIALKLVAGPATEAGTGPTIDATAGANGAADQKGGRRGQPGKPGRGAAKGKAG
jgi:hypothetical protein